MVDPDASGPEVTARPVRSGSATGVEVKIRDAAPPAHPSAGRSGSPSASTVDRPIMTTQPTSLYASGLADDATQDLSAEDALRCRVDWVDSEEME